MPLPKAPTKMGEVLKGESNRKTQARKKLKTCRTNKDYTPKLIYMTIKKYKNRLSRNRSRLISLREGLYVTPMNRYIDK